MQLSCSFLLVEEFSPCSSLLRIPRQSAAAAQGGRRGGGIMNGWWLTCSAASSAICLCKRSYTARQRIPTHQSPASETAFLHREGENGKRGDAAAEITMHALLHTILHSPLARGAMPFSLAPCAASASPRASAAPPQALAAAPALHPRLRVFM